MGKYVLFLTCGFRRLNLKIRSPSLCFQMCTRLPKDTVKSQLSRDPQTWVQIPSFICQCILGTSFSTYLKFSVFFCRMGTTISIAPYTGKVSTGVKEVVISGAKFKGASKKISVIRICHTLIQLLKFQN